MRVLILACCICAISLFSCRMQADHSGSSSGLYRPATATSHAKPAPLSSSARQWEDEIFYVVLPQVFFNGDTTNDFMLKRYGAKRDQILSGGFWGGDLAGVIQKLDYVSSLGVTTLFLNPIVQNDQHEYFRHLATGYRPSDYFNVDENFGTTQTAKTLVDLAHARGIRVVLDMPLALCGIRNPYLTQEFRDRGWFTSATAYGMPIWNADNPETRAHLNSVGRYWRDKMGVDGYRLDSALLLSKSFWKSFAETMRDAAHPDFFLLGEIVASPAEVGPYLTSTTLDSCYDWGTTRLQGVFGAEEPMNQIGFFQWGAHECYTNALRMIGELDNYPENSFIAMTAEPKQKRAKLALACLLTLDRIPMIYSGDEIGLVPGGVGRVFAPENQNPEFLSYVKRLIAIRKQEVALRRGVYKEAYQEKRVIAYTRTLGEEQVLFVANASPSSKTLTFPVGGVPWKDLELTDLMLKKRAKARGETPGIFLDAYQAAILKVR